MPGRDAGPSSTLGPDARTGLVDPSEGYKTDALAQRRARRQAASLILALRELLAGFDSGELPFPVFACSLDAVASLLADIALRGELVA
ncbi:MAG: hypothetical protein ABSD97_00200 [Acidimicrobiales bacterium]|jgi:hypothetical protein